MLPSPDPAQIPSSATDCFVYVLGWIGDGRYLTYVGWTNDVALRLAKHNSGRGARSTRGRVWVLLHTERFTTRQEAMSREWHLKRDRAFRKQLAQTHLGR
ncbi:MAG: Excinuclease subunit domain protein [Xanthobacteraceae bacterium]|nr:Excinuclease subunit domain protein [Xanthobacteraceae bacterium]